MCDEGYNDEDVPMAAPSPRTALFKQVSVGSEQECEELAYRLLAALPRSRIATIQRKLAPLLQFDVVGSLPAEVSLYIFSLLPAYSLITCSLVCKQWYNLSNDQSVWKHLCALNGWEWRQPRRHHPFEPKWREADSDDEGMGGSDEEAEEDDDAMGDIDEDSGFYSFTADGPSTSSAPVLMPLAGPSRARLSLYPRPPQRHSAPPILPSPSSNGPSRPDYKLLHQTHVRLRNRFMSSTYRLSALQTRGAPANAHTNTIYCLQLYTYPETGKQVLFTGSRDKTVREWNVEAGLVERVISGVHGSSILSICVHNKMLASAGSDRRLAIWDLEKNKLITLIQDHEDSVLCVRFDEERVVSCSKDRTVRTYRFPDLKPEFVLTGHRAAVNAVSISRTLIVSGSGDRSVKLWNTKNGQLLRSFDNHHTRGIASIDFLGPYILSGSSDKHLRLFDITTLQGWSTSSQHGDGETANPPGLQCQACGSTNVNITGEQGVSPTDQCMHNDLVRSVALGEDLVVSGSYDLAIKVWDRRTGALVANLSGGHTGRIFCVGFDCTKIVSCGEDQRICIWDFSHGVDTSFLKL
ncbi:WD40 repeat-like protein [Cylindrobasidium torrendii FP15055 ss-10]|uniref:WD40 repeat-like protein n=1 Tax=Cylindrobasidium torrendii FP15055 ss-10 TaxID=1314674 RepID=A0A0D7AZN9_9AGAR|nr:WD40 repeat-like protein [Cylindrobasidium torrendii FP15055 ss-10]